MLGQSESARVQASRVLMDALAAARPGGCPVCPKREAELPDARAKLLALLARGDGDSEKKRRQVIREELAAVSEFADVSKIEERLFEPLEAV